MLKSKSIPDDVVDWKTKRNGRARAEKKDRRLVLGSWGTDGISRTERQGKGSSRKNGRQLTMEEEILREYDGMLARLVVRGTSIIQT